MNETKLNLTFTSYTEMFDLNTTELFSKWVGQGLKTSYVRFQTMKYRLASLEFAFPDILTLFGSKLVFCSKIAAKNTILLRHYLFS